MPLLPVITSISDDAGDTLEPADEFRVKSPFSVARVVDGDRTRIELRFGSSAPGQLGDIQVDSIVIGVGHSGDTNLDVTGISLFRGRVRFADGGDGVWPAPSVTTPPLAMGEDSKTCVVVAGVVPLRIGNIGWIPESDLGSDGTNNVIVSLYLSDLAIGDSGETLIGSAAISSEDAPWTAGEQAGLFDLGTMGGIYTLAASKRIIARVQANGSATLAGGGTVVVYAPT